MHRPARRQDASKLACPIAERVRRHGLDGERPATYRQIGPKLGYSHSSIWVWQHEALARLSHPSHSYRLRSLLTQAISTVVAAAIRANFNPDAISAIIMTAYVAGVDNARQEMK